ncbi:hypothetical protein AB4Z17_30625, partial [Paenibacillus sp. TAF43_2]|uniref:hypothetical protein n=1 Tax=Paenibacillus sp. TAF43_2 TaxID=3233069 RepID=UPI003F9D1527
ISTPICNIPILFVKNRCTFTLIYSPLSVRAHYNHTTIIADAGYGQSELLCATSSKQGKN